MAQRGDVVPATPLGPAAGPVATPADLATFSVSPLGVVTGWSDAAQRVLGYGAAEATGRVLTDVLGVDPSHEAWQALVRAAEWTGTVTLRHRDGRRIDLGLAVHPSLSSDGHSHGFTVAVSTDPPQSGHDQSMLEWGFAQAPVALASFDTELRCQLANRVTGDMVGVDVARLRGRRYQDVLPGVGDVTLLGQQLRQVAETGTPATYDAAVVGERAWNIEMWPVRDPSGRVRGVSTAAFDNSKQQTAQERLALLNEAGARIGTTLDVTRTAWELAQLVVPRLADYVTVDLLDSVLAGEEPTVERVDGGIVLRRIAHLSAVEGVPKPAVELGATDTYPPFSPPARCLAAGRPLLSGTEDPGFIEWVSSDPARGPDVQRGFVRSGMAVPLQARGVMLGAVLFWRRQRPEPFQPDDLLLAEELAGRAAVSMDNARRYTREHTTMLTLQRSLLPRALPGQAAVQAAFRYLPASSAAGVGGDWFDVIPLSGTRVALVVGDIAGHGVHASAAMGRLRTAVRTLADVDLPPDELLTHLDDLVTHLVSDLGVEPPGPSAGEFGATCLYAVYDPVSRRCTVASAGHLPPSVLYPDGTVATVALSPGPPLGVGGVPFEASELELPEGSLIALYTDGLIEARDRDVDAGFARLHDTLSDASPSLELTCDTLIKSMLPERPPDDVALLVARTRALHTDQVATWGLPADPEIVSDARVQASRQLAAWGLGDMAFITELVVSELVTNAIRYGEAPIQLRLIRDRTLICEVSDGSSTAPHMRRARTYDEGGRGLLLVAQLSQGWGTRQTTTGKTIWAEQALPDGWAERPLPLGDV